MMKRTKLYLEEAQIVALDEIAGGQGISRAELVRRLLDRGISNTRLDQQFDLAATEESFGVLAGAEFSRSPDERAAHLDRLRRS